MGKIKSEFMSETSENMDVFIIFNSEGMLRL